MLRDHSGGGDGTGWQVNKCYRSRRSELVRWGALVLLGERLRRGGQVVLAANKPEGQPHAEQLAAWLAAWVGRSGGYAGHGERGGGGVVVALSCLLGVRVRPPGVVNKVFFSPPSPGARWRQPGRNNRASTNILMHWLADAMAHSYYGTSYLGTDGRWNGTNSPIDPWQRGHEGGVERGHRTPSMALIA